MVSPNALIMSMIREAMLPSVSEVCRMESRGRGQCWGCPVTECVRQIMPFQDEAVDAEVLTKALELLRTNRYYVGSTPGRKVYEALLSGLDGDEPLQDGETEEERAGRILLSELINSRQDFVTELALDRVEMGLSTADQAAKMAGHTHYGDHPRNRKAFTEKLRRREALHADAEQVVEGTQRHSSPIESSEALEYEEGRSKRTSQFLQNRIVKKVS